MPFQDPAGGAVFEDVPAGVQGSDEEGPNGLPGRAHPRGELQAGAAGGRGSDAGGAPV